jgi:molybdenum cofactor biosynthesis protein B
MDEPDADGSADRADETLRIGVITIASDRSLESDESGTVIGDNLENGGHEVTVREHVTPDHDTAQSIVSRFIDRDDVDVVITAGSTGVEPSDITVEAVEPLVEKTLATFSELFTVLAYERIGTEAITARTFAGIAEGTVVFCLPGDADAVRLALEEIVLSEAPRIAERAGEDEPGAEEGEKPSEADAVDGGD